MKQLTDAERLEIAMSLLDEHQVDEYANRCSEFEHQPERNGFHDVPAECEDFECSHCPLYYDETGRKQIGCPYIDTV